MLFFSFNPFTDWLSSPSFLSVFDLDWPQPKPQLQQNLPQPRPPTAKPKDPDSYDFGGNEEAAKDYRYDKKALVYDRTKIFTEPPNRTEPDIFLPNRTVPNRTRYISKILILLKNSIFSAYSLLVAYKFSI